MIKDKKKIEASSILFRDWYTFIYPLFFLVSDSFKEAYKNQETEALISSEIPRFYILLRPLSLPFLLCFVKLSFLACAGRRRSTENSCVYC